MNNTTQPRYLAIKQALLTRIETGRLPSGSKVASENALAQEFGVSRMTARRALDELADEGVLVRSQGLGSFVADERPTGSPVEIRNIADEIAARGHAWRCEVLVLESQVALAKRARQLGVAEGQTVFFSSLLHFENDVPLQIEDRWVNPQVAPDYLQQLFGEDNNTPSAYLSRVAPLTEADHLIEAVAASARQQALLQIAASEPLLKVSRRTSAAQGVVSYAQLFHPGSRFRLGGHVNY
ncbi:histidine utilization repressor [Simiduia agarivorans]|uniref:Histidine utilization repressor n=1 Tax=Simiduia agarivorans (strain DSM 21679 / JCM 13881 / BCRC 17597 / SA1) TaxID=1117647 RepID=K4KEP1_SIMAS|nr:histidine utilization repressor [Simiduia agarivorans]AFU97529.1 histidine utilization repressor [Simiduia agarivorans SA1 = DSM 21679]